jgi:hypothetical protein
MPLSTAWNPPIPANKSTKVNAGLGNLDMRATLRVAGDTSATTRGDGDFDG